MWFTIHLSLIIVLNRTFQKFCFYLKLVFPKFQSFFHLKSIKFYNLQLNPLITFPLNYLNFLVYISQNLKDDRPQNISQAQVFNTYTIQKTYSYQTSIIHFNLLPFTLHQDQLNFLF